MRALETLPWRIGGADFRFRARGWGADDAQSDRRDVGGDEGAGEAAPGSGGDGDSAGWMAEELKREWAA